MIVLTAIDARFIDTCTGVKITKKFHAVFKGFRNVFDFCNTQVDVTKEAGITRLEQDLLTDIGIDTFAIGVVLLLNNPNVTLSGSVHDCFQFVWLIDDVRINVDTALDPRNTSPIVINKLQNVTMICVKMSNDRTITVRSTTTKDFVELGVNLHEPTRT